MPFKLLFHPATHDDIDYALSRYESINTTLAIRFETELLKCYEKLSINPQYYFIVHKKLNVRRIVLKTFPYKLIFQLQKNNTVWIIALLHQKQKASRWMKRVKN